MKARPLARASGVPKIKTTPMIGIGLSATPTPNESTWPIASPTMTVSPARVSGPHPIRVNPGIARRSGLRFAQDRSVEP